MSEKEASERLAEQVMDLGRRMMAHMESRISGAGLTMPQAMLLRELDEPLAMNRVAERLHCDASNVTGIVDRLENRGLVERRVRPGDRRVKELVLTADGERVRAQVEAALAAMPGVGSLSAADQGALHDLLWRALSDFGE